ncbi:sugar ABC transporter ATP-binding protein, partial [candidate division GN15 bacterium]
MSSSLGTGGKSEAVLFLTGISKRFPGVLAVSDADFELRAGEIHALVGENGAGKSTLIKIVTGVHRADSGEMYVAGESTSFQSPLQARRTGITAIYQEFTLVPTLSVCDNLFLGRESARFGFVDHPRQLAEAKKALETLGVSIDLESRVDELSVGHQQMIEIARALMVDCRILVMDEPTAALTPWEVERLFQVLR